MPTISITPEGSASILTPGLPAVIGGTGAADDASDATYVELVRRVTGHHPVTGADTYANTNTYIWEGITPAPELGTWPGDGTTATWRARIEVVANDIAYPAESDSFYRFGLASSTAFVGIGGDVVAAGATVGVPQSTTGAVEVDEESWETLRTGTYPGIGELGFGFSWFGAGPASPLVNDTGDETRVRLYEFEWQYTTADEVRVTRLFPRDDAYGLGSAPRLVPPPRGGRIVGGYQ